MAAPDEIIPSAAIAYVDAALQSTTENSAAQTAWPVDKFVQLLIFFIDFSVIQDVVVGPGLDPLRLSRTGF